MIRKITSHSADIENYMERVRTQNRKDFERLNSMILKLAEYGGAIVNGRTFKKIRTARKSKKPIIQIKIITKHYRIHTVLTESTLHLVHAFDKKKGKTPKKDLSLSIKRANNISNL